MLRLTVRDEGTAPPREAHEVTVELPAAPITMRELLRQRIEQEVAQYNAGGAETFRGLVTPHRVERELNPPRRRRAIDAEQQVEAAITAFERTRLLVIVDDRQVEELDEPLVLRPDSDVAFVKLVPLAGG
jgi:hypothetical protein